MKAIRGTRRRARAAIAAGVAILAGTLVGCAEEPRDSRVMDAGSANVDGPFAPEQWTPFGPFLKPNAFSGATGAPGPVDVVVPGRGDVWLDATELLPGEEIESELYSFTYDGDTPVIAGIVQVRVPPEDDHPARLRTSVLGISMTATGEGGTKAVLLTRTNVFTGVEHTASLGATSELGVVAVLIDGELLPESEQMRRLIGVDVVRGTEVWFKEHGEPLYGEGSAIWFAGDVENPGEIGCDGVLEGFSVASGKTLWRVNNLRALADAEWGGECPELGSVNGEFVPLTWGGDVVGVLDVPGGHVVEFAARRIDPELPLAVVGGEPDTGVDLVVQDLRTGKIMYSMVSAQVDELGLSVRALIDGFLYADSSDGRVLIDVRTGEHLRQEWEEYPLAVLGDHLWMSDGGLVPR